MKSSAVSVSTFPGLAGRDSAPSRPSGAPVVKEKVSAHAGVASHTPRPIVRALKLDGNLMAILRHCLDLGACYPLPVWERFTQPAFLTDGLSPERPGLA